MRFDGERIVNVLLKYFFTGDPAWLIDALLDSTEESRYAILSTVRTELTQRLEDAIRARAESEKAEKEIEADEEAEEEEAFDPARLIAELGRLLEGILEETKSSQTLLQILLSVDAKEARDMVEPLILRLKDVDLQTAQLISQAVHRRKPRLWPKWLNNLPSSLMMGAPGARAQTLDLVTRLWQYALSDTPESDENLLIGASAIARLLDEADEAFIEETETSAIQLGEPVSDAGEIEQHLRRLHLSRLFAAHGLSSEGRVIREEIQSLTHTLELKAEEEDIESALAEYVITALESIFQYASSKGESIEQALRLQLARGIASCEWLSEFDHARLVVTFAAYSEEGSELSQLELPISSIVASYRADLSADAFDKFLSHWLCSTDEQPADVLPILEQDLCSAPSAQLLAATASWARRLDAEEQYILLAKFAGKSGEPLRPANVLEAVGISRIPDGDVVSILVDRYKTETSNPNRRIVLDLWKQASLSEQSARERAIREILIPFVGLNGQATNIVLGSLKELASPVPSAVRKSLGSAVVRATKGRTELEERGRRVLSEMGYNIERKGLFGQRKEVNISS